MAITLADRNRGQSLDPTVSLQEHRTEVILAMQCRNWQAALAGSHVVALLLLCLSSPGRAQEIEPRRWTHIPINTNFAGAGYAFTRADIYFDPVLETDDVVLDDHAVAARYIRSFALVGRTARAEVEVLHEDARWEGVLRGEAAAVTRGGFADPLLRFSLILVGGPPLAAPEFAKYRATHPVDTVVGAALGVKVPVGQYYADKLLNLGENRFKFRPELGVVHNRHKWSVEATGSFWFFTDNDEFWNGSKRGQDPLFIIQGHLMYTFRSGLWVGGSAAHGYGGESTVNGVAKNDTRESVTWGASLGYPFSRSLGVKIAYIGTESLADVGFDSSTIASGFSVVW